MGLEVDREDFDEDRQRRAFAEALATTANREAATRRMLARYTELSETEAPVHSWPHGSPR